MKPNRDLCIMACVFCRDPLFQQWVKMQRDVVQLPCFGKGAPLGGEARRTLQVYLLHGFKGY